MSGFYPLLMSIFSSNESINPLIYLNFGLAPYSLSLKTSKQKHGLQGFFLPIKPCFHKTTLFTPFHTFEN